MNIVLLCGGPSKEHDISLNSVRSVYDHLRTMQNVSAKVIFIDKELKRYLINEKFLYSNTTYDFEFTLTENDLLSDDDFKATLNGSDLVFPVMHGEYGEDGQIQAIFETNSIPFIGSPSSACRVMYNKQNADEKLLRANGLRTIPKLWLNDKSDIQAEIEAFMSANGFRDVIIKPVKGGSSIGVSKANSVEEAVETAKKSLAEYGDLVVEQVCKGKEFTVIILQTLGQDGQLRTVALMPTEVEILDKNGNAVQSEIFDKRKKYLSTTETRYHCPARFGTEKNDEIRHTAEKLFKLAGARDFLRIDGWLLDDGTVYFSDFNPISGMEQNSFIFQQAAAIGLRHKDLLALIVRTAAARYELPEFRIPEENNAAKKRLNLILGGITSERQVSLMSGTNSWLKLLNSNKYYPVPYILFQENGDWTVYEVPYAAALKHTTEEIYDYINGRAPEYKAYSENLKKTIREELDITDFADYTGNANPGRMTLPEFIAMTKEMDADVFIGLHGGFGENGGLQKYLEDAGIHFNGAGSKAAELCMNKYDTGVKVRDAKIPQVRTCGKKMLTDSDVQEILNAPEAQWKAMCRELSGDSIVIKPNGDGCSTGIVVLHKASDLKTYFELLSNKMPYIPENTFDDQPEKIQLPKEMPMVLCEEYIKTKQLCVTDKDVQDDPNAEWVELTVGVLEKNGVYHSLNPSITVADNAVLSLEEKFQGGTGINITPPPFNIISEKFLAEIKTAMEAVAGIFGIKDYCRIDIFANNKRSEIIVIELNTLPGLSPSTVLFQQGAKEEPPFYPMELLETIISQ